MKNLNEVTKNKKSIIITAAVSVILFTAVFLFSSLINKNKITENPIATAVPKISNSAVTDEDLKKMVNFVKPGDEKTSVSDESIKSLVAPDKKNKNTKNTTGSVSDDALKGAVAPMPK